MYEKYTMVIEHANKERESHPLSGRVPFTFYEHEGQEKIAMNCWVDFIGIEESSFLGGSESYALLWGLRITDSEFREKGVVLETSELSFERDEHAEASALFFAGEFFKIGQLRLETMGKRRFRVHLVIQDLSGESEEFNTGVWIDGELEDEPCEMEYPE